MVLYDARFRRPDDGRPLQRHQLDGSSPRPVSLWPIAVRALDLANGAREFRDLQSPPGNQLEKLKRSLAGFHSIRINDQFRVVFRQVERNARDVRITDDQ